MEEQIENSPKETSFDDKLAENLLTIEENETFEFKRVRDKLNSSIETIVAFANSEGGILVLGLEDPKKAQCRDRIYGLQENIQNWDELRKLISTRITDEKLLPIKFLEFGCTLRDGNKGTLGVVKIEKSPTIHSIVGDGTFIRLRKSNKEITALEIHELMFARGTITAEAQTVDIDFDLLKTGFWQAYVDKRKLTRNIDQAMYHIGLSKKDAQGNLKPTKAAVLLFAEDPAGLLASKATIRIFHYHGDKIETDPKTNLVKPPKTITGPLHLQIQEAAEYVVQELANGIQMGHLGFEVIQKYPLRVIREAITNAVIHRDYHLNADIQIRLFVDRIEIESPGLLVGPVTTANIATIGTYSRNPLIANNLREFPNPPNLDAGEGVRMMFGTMKQASLYPPIYASKATTGRNSVMVTLLNQNMPSIWEQVSDYIDKHGFIGNKEVRKIMGSDDTLRASKMLRGWVKKGLLNVDNPEGGTKSRRYKKSYESILLTLLWSSLYDKKNKQR